VRDGVVCRIANPRLLGVRILGRLSVSAGSPDLSNEDAKREHSHSARTKISCISSASSSMGLLFMLLAIAALSMSTGKFPDVIP
jgi:hypothetical protein